MADQLILFTKFPEPGQVKTRLIPALGKKGASTLHQQLTEHCLQQISPVPRNSQKNLTIFYTGGSRQLMEAWIPDIPLIRQQGSSLGQRITTAFTLIQTQHKKQRIILFGADCPDLNEKTIAQALNLLNNQDLVFGPTFDGGFYLIGIKACYQTSNLTTLLTNISWGTATVLQETLAHADILGNSYGLLTTLHDIDLPEDLEHLHHHPSS
jgi:rSAM/selenodomain-associated transferase 1